MSNRMMEVVSQILEAAGGTIRQAACVSSFYTGIARNMNRKILSGPGYVEPAHRSDVIAVHLMINWLELRLAGVEQQLEETKKLLTATGQDAPEQECDARSYTDEH